jgi:membrane-associated phospholipid phosphatase
MNRKISFILISIPLFALYPNIYSQTDSISYSQGILNSMPDSEVGPAADREISSVSWFDPITKLPKDIFSFGEEAFRPDNLKTTAALLTITGALTSIDRFTTEPFYRNYHSSPMINEASNGISYLGGGEFHIITASVFCAAGLILGDNRTIRTGLQIVEAELTCGLTVQILKRVAGRESPQSATHPNGLFRPFPNLKAYSKNESKYYSFPSGHISTSTALLTVIANNYPEAGWIKPVGYSVVGLIGVSLMTRGWHWLSDFPIALGMGYTFGKVITDRNAQNNKDKNENSKLSIYPAYLDGPAIGINYNF